MKNSNHHPDCDDLPAGSARRVGRRQLLKALGVAGGAAALAGLPGRWTTPVVEVGLLPAHAQASLFIIFNLRRELVVSSSGSSGAPATCDNNGQTGNLYQVLFDYLNPFGGLRPGSTVDHSFEFEIGASGSFEIVTGAANISGDGVNGSVMYTVCSAFGVSENTMVTTTVFCTDVDGRRSNTLSVVTTRPTGALDDDSSDTAFERKP